MKKKEHSYWVYIVASESKVIYIGVTNNLRRRIKEHWERLVPGFTQKYNCCKLVYFEYSTYINNAIAREKQLKRWSRVKKVELIEKDNPEWKDLAKSWED